MVSDRDAVGASAKLTGLSTLLRQFAISKERCVLVSSSTASLDLLDRFLRHSHYSFLRYPLANPSLPPPFPHPPSSASVDHSQSVQRRQRRVAQFSVDCDIAILLMASRLPHIAHEIAWTAAHAVVLFDLDWLPRALSSSLGPIFHIFYIYVIDD